MSISKAKGARRQATGVRLQATGNRRQASGIWQRSGKASVDRQSAKDK